MRCGFYCATDICTYCCLFDLTINLLAQLDFICFVITQVKQSWLHGKAAFVILYCLESNIALMILRLACANLWCRYRLTIFDKFFSLQIWSPASFEATMMAAAYSDLDITLAMNKPSVLLLHIIAIVRFSLLSDRTQITRFALVPTRRSPSLEYDRIFKYMPVVNKALVMVICSLPWSKLIFSVRVDLISIPLPSPMLTECTGCPSLTYDWSHATRSEAPLSMTMSLSVMNSDLTYVELFFCFLSPTENNMGDSLSFGMLWDSSLLLLRLQAWQPLPRCLFLLQ